MNVDTVSEMYRHMSFLENGVPITIIGGNYVGDLLARPRELGGKTYMDVVLAYQIIADRYRWYLQSHNLV